MFERFTDRARRVLVLAQEEAKRLDHAFIGTEHILLGLLSEGEGIGAKALRELGVDADVTRRRVEQVIGRGNPVEVLERPPFTPRSKQVLELALKEALGLGHNYIGTEHLLLGLVREGEGVGHQILVQQGLSATKVRNQVVALLAGYLQQGGTGSAAPSKTPAGARVEAAAQRAANTERVGTQHYLVALLRDEHSLACRVLASFGVTAEAVQRRIQEIGAGGTDDETPPPYSAQVVSGGVTIRIEDPAMAAKVQSGELVVTFKSPAATPSQPDEPDGPDDAENEDENAEDEPGAAT
jgi:ATP-dependent Clp protease ATP-binding subunit ClpA